MIPSFCSFLAAAAELRRQLFLLADSVQRLNSTLLTLLRQRDRLLTRRGHHYDLITAVLQAVSPKRPLRRTGTGSWR
ncbi:hypothetical protein IscW_ISCW006361 [Ixodes scapularis]|uniref:Uncharacterized protein n=1 Tax=Ixodes scapularis TaxID=6945 RepID=B7PPC5_IXOSC|nr:hypothetical protein IscW_ISCW006361 [Ixodes scapularis]|eukprot:XP_002435617.1 hypothetical protein IscW_ISCW006361 [Ixodes scapularis]